MSSNITIDETGDEAVCEMSGTIDETVDFSSISQVTKKVIVFDLGGVELINSIGIREWIIWMKKQARDVHYVFRRCPKVIVDQMNVMTGFLPESATVESFYVPFHCEECDRVEHVLFHRAQDFTRGTADAKETVAPPERVCASCATAMSIDVMESKYFSFLRYRQR